jgi:hypothetical protein
MDRENSLTLLWPEWEERTGKKEIVVLIFIKAPLGFSPQNSLMNYN